MHLPSFSLTTASLSSIYLGVFVIKFTRAPINPESLNSWRNSTIVNALEPGILECLKEFHICSMSWRPEIKEFLIVEERAVFDY